MFSNRHCTPLCVFGSTSHPHRRHHPSFTFSPGCRHHRLLVAWPSPPPLCSTITTASSPSHRRRLTWPEAPHPDDPGRGLFARPPMLPRLATTSPVPATSSPQGHHGPRRRHKLQQGLNLNVRRI
jgi:hypothetical protein